MILSGKVLKAFNDKNTGITYTPEDEYKDSDIFQAERARYEELYYKGFVEKGKKVEEKHENKVEKNK